MCRQTRSSSRYTPYDSKPIFLLIQVNIEYVMLQSSNFSNISLLTLYAEMFKLMNEMLEAMNHDNGCKIYECYANVKPFLEVRNGVRMSIRTFTATRLVSTLLANHNSECISAGCY